MLGRHELGKRRTALAAGAVYCLSRSAAYVPHIRKEPPQDPIVQATAGIPLLMWAYVAVWAVAGVVCLAHLRSGHVIAPLAGVVGCMSCWAAVWLLGWLADTSTLYWQTALTYGCPAVLIAALVGLTPIWTRTTEGK